MTYPCALAAHLEQLPVAEAYEVMTWVQPHVEKLLVESERILEAASGG